MKDPTEPYGEVYGNIWTRHVAVTAPGGSRNAAVIGRGYSIDHAASQLATAVRAG
jgi:hypothetical protein